jgi:tight adherence protein B
LKPLGWGCLLISAGFWLLGNYITKRQLAEFEDLMKFNFCEEPAVKLALIKTAVHSGCNLLRSFECLAEPLEALNLRSSVHQLKNGVPYKYAGLPDYLMCLEPAYTDGVSPLPLISAKLQEITTARRSGAGAAGEKLGVQLVVPLGACYLPAFIFLGIVPVIVGML